MHRDLNEIEIDEVLDDGLYGHLGCITEDKQMYIVPITYAYKNGSIYSFSYPGLKIDSLRKNPIVCFQTELFMNEVTWRSIIVWGTYEELSGEDQIKGMKTLFDRLDREEGKAVSPLYHPSIHVLAPVARTSMKEKSSVFYRINIDRKTGKRVEYQ